VSDPEQPERLDPGRKVTVEDIRELMGASTPHFALQIRSRIRRLIEGLPADDPARTAGEGGIELLEQLAYRGQTEGRVQQQERALPSLELDARG